MADLITMLSAVAGQQGEEVDEDFNQTVLLLHGDGTNGAQNNTFLDSSTNNFTITRNGNTTQGTFSPFSVGAGEWSNYFDGTDDYLNLGGQSELAFGAGDFCIEFFVYFSGGLGADIVLYDSRPNNTNGAYPTIYVNSSNKVVYVTSSADRITSTTSMAYGSWFHICVSRSGTDTKLFINGTQEGSTYSDSTTYLNGASRPTIGTNGFNVTAAELPGYISNLRVVKGSTVRTANFTVPTSPLSAITNTQLLTCQSNRFVDNSTNAFAITRNGDVRVTPFSPFAPTAAYSAGTNGGSGYFDGSGDYFTYSPSTSNQFGTGSFTVEAWYYPMTAPTSSNAAFMYDARTASVTTTWAFGFRLNGTGTGNLLGWFNGTAILEGAALNLNAWNHVVYVRDGGTNIGSLFLNGTRTATQTDSTNYSSTGATATIASRYTIENYINGYLANLRLVKGTAVYDPSQTTLTVPTAPLTAITNTSLLLNFTNAGIIDNTGKNNLETVGNAQIDTTTKKYGTGSLEFDGTGDWLLMPNTPDQQLGTGNFTIEFWVYLATGDTGSARGLVAKGTSTTGWLVSLDSSEKVVFTYTTSTITSSGAITTNAWNHIAVVREGTGSNQTKIYIGGTNDGTGTVSTDFNQTSVMYVGANRTGGDAMKGFIDDLRITKGIARYTANFSVPGKAFPDL